MLMQCTGGNDEFCGDFTTTARRTVIASIRAEKPPDGRLSHGRLTSNQLLDFGSAVTQHFLS